MDDLLSQVDAGELGDPLPVLAYLAGQAVDIDDEERNGALRRALLLVANVRDLPAAREACLFLAADVDLAWRLFALALLAEELAE